MEAWGEEANGEEAVSRATLEAGLRPQFPQKLTLSGNSEPQYWQCCIVFPPVQVKGTRR
ncbi:MAG: hypothetical protein NVSMB27_13020 [Ktedonobacteraceae bacterium]